MQRRDQYQGRRLPQVRRPPAKGPFQQKGLTLDRGNLLRSILVLLPSVLDRTVGHNPRRELDYHLEFPVQPGLSRRNTGLAKIVSLRTRDVRLQMNVDKELI